MIRCVSGGSINSAHIVGHNHSAVFVKTNQQSLLPMFEAEALGLLTIAKAGAINVPTSYCTGTSEATSFIAMQVIETSSAAENSYARFGEQLAMLHQYQSKQFGAQIDNTIGSTPQHNARSDNWFDFWREHRLGFQLELAKLNHAPGTLIDDAYALGDQMEDLFDAPPKAACLHGDLWQGNWTFDASGNAVIFDPAHYFGDRETDIAMTTLFGRAHPDFYEAYNNVYPLSEHYTTRQTFYNLYHILNHYNLFGGGYANQAHQMVQSLLSELR